jgi:hypothetical protein
MLKKSVLRWCVCVYFDVREIFLYLVSSDCENFVWFLNFFYIRIKNKTYFML